MFFTDVYGCAHPAKAVYRAMFLKYMLRHFTAGCSLESIHKNHGRFFSRISCNH